MDSGDHDTGEGDSDRVCDKTAGACRVLSHTSPHTILTVTPRVGPVLTPILQKKRQSLKAVPQVGGGAGPGALTAAWPFLQREPQCHPRRGTGVPHAHGRQAPSWVTYGVLGLVLGWGHQAPVNTQTPAPRTMPGSMCTGPGRAPELPGCFWARQVWGSLPVSFSHF